MSRIHVATLAILWAALFGTGRPAAAGQFPGAPDRAPVPPEITELVEAHNRERVRADLAPLRLEPRLTAAARVHARDMAEHMRLEHRGSNGSTPARRVARQGYHYRKTGENIAAGQATVADVMRSWMNSRGHRRNILGDYTEIGAACVLDPDDVPYWCVEFGLPIPQLDPDRAVAELVERLNRERTEARRPPLDVDPKLGDAARDSARDMAERNALRTNHDDRSAPLNRIENQGYRSLGLSVAAGEPTPRDVVRTWMDKPGHRKNILGDYSVVGAGYATAKDGTPYWCVVFAIPARE
jgi:uncharacterized protein YkwD